MTDVWKKKQKAHEEDYFEKKEREILKNLKTIMQKKERPETESQTSPDKSEIRKEPVDEPND